MSYTFNQSVKSMGLVFALMASSFAANAEKLSFNQLVAYNVNQMMVQLKYELDAELEQSTYELAMGNMSEQMTVEGRRPVVKMTKVERSEEE